jgi:DNA-binding transcriptional MerR regulator
MAYTPSEVCELLQMRPSTLRKYSKQYSDFLSFTAPRHHRTYTSADVSTLETIRGVARNRLIKGKSEKLEQIKIYLSPPEDPSNKSDTDLLTFSERFEELTEQVRLWSELVTKSEEDYKRLLARAGEMSSRLGYFVKRYSEIEKKLMREIAYIESRRDELQKLKDRVRTLENRKVGFWTDINFLG